MRWDQMKQSGNVEDRRGARSGGGGIRLGGVGLLGVLFVGWLFGVSPATLMGLLQQGPGATPERQESAPPAADEGARFVSAVLGDTEEVWGRLFREMHNTYPEPRLVLFDGEVQSACGFQSAAVGPFYCPPDRQLYLDLSFFRDLAGRFQAPGDFAQAYVIGHEVGHHVQNILGLTAESQARKYGLDESKNELSVRQELQADCLAGVWGHYAKRRDLLEPGDMEEALQAAAAIGDDRLQMNSSGRVAPDSFTHGTSAQRLRWFKAGFDSGALERCDTYGAQRL